MPSPMLQEVLSAWNLQGSPITPLTSGHINLTFRVDGPQGGFVLQRLAPIFASQVNLDIEVITQRLADQGLLTPRLVRTAAGQAWWSDEAGRCWRLLSYISGATFLQADSAERCEQGGALLGRFHAALWDFQHTFVFGRLGVHDTRSHLKALRHALAEHTTHARFSLVRSVANEILERTRQLPKVETLPAHIVHGDPKISNIVFAPQGQALCLIDLDTLAPMPLAVELGDAFRSWCQRGGEENENENEFDLDFYRAGLSGYLEAIGDRPDPNEIQAIPGLIETIALELAARFATDALNESYFGWDHQRFARAADHNLLRSRSQLALARDLRAQRANLENTLAKLTVGLRPG